MAREGSNRWISEDIITPMTLLSLSPLMLRALCEKLSCGLVRSAVDVREEFLPDYPWPSAYVLLNGRGQTDCKSL